MSFAQSIRKSISKKTSATIHEGFYGNELWTGSGNFSINRMLSGRYDDGFPFGKTIAIGGQSGSAKSLLAATGLANAQKRHGAIGVWIDAEHASKESWLEGLGVDTSPEKLIYANVATVEDVKTIVSTISKDMRALDEDKRVPVYMVVDSYSFLMTGAQFEQAEKGDVVGDMGQHAKQLKDLIKASTHLIARIPICLVGMLHTMASTDKYNPDEILLGGRGIEYAASIVIVLNKMKLRAEDLSDADIAKEIAEQYEDENLGKRIVGIRCKAQVYKSRFAKPNESSQIQIPFPHGIDPYSGLFEQMKGEGLFTSPSSGWYQYTNLDGEIVKFQRSKFKSDGHADVLMQIGMQVKVRETRIEIPEEIEEVDEEPGVGRGGLTDETPKKRRGRG